MKRGVRIGPTPRDTVLVDGTARLLHFRRESTPEEGATAADEGAAPASKASKASKRAAAKRVAKVSPPVLLVPSMINRWYVLDLRPGVSLAASLVERGLDTWLLDWGVPEDEDRYRTWGDGVARIARMVRRVKRETGADKVVLLGYCMGATISSVYASLYPNQLAAFINLAGPIDFEHAGFLGALVDRKHFDPEALTAAGNLPARMMESGFTTLRPTGQISKWVALADRGLDPSFREAFEALETWSGDNVPFPGACYVTYIRDLYQDNALARGEHRVGGRVADLSNIRCPLLTITASRDHICPPAAANALNALVGSKSKDTLEVPGGHVGAVVGSRASRTLYPAIADWIEKESTWS